MFVTTSLKGAQSFKEEALRAAKALEIPYVERGHYGVEELCDAYGSEYFLALTAKGPVIYNREGLAHSFHVSMAHLRILSLSRGGSDHLVETCRALRENCQSVLDCTVGLGSDILTMAYAFGPQCQLLGLEKNPLLAYVTQYGFTHLVGAYVEGGCIDIERADYEPFLREAPDSAYDIVYFDPMFTQPVKESSQFEKLRPLLTKEESPLRKDLLEEALRVSTYGVIVKERQGALLFEELGIKEICGGTYSRVAYGILRKS